MATKSVPQDEFITVAEVRKSPRGRKAELDDTLMEKLGQIDPSDTSDTRRALRLVSYGTFTTKEERQKFSGIVRKNWNAVHPGTKPSTNYDSDGVAQVNLHVPRKSS